MVATAPPMNTVHRIPILSHRIPAIGEQHNVEPKVSDPINAVYENNCQLFTNKGKVLVLYNIFEI